MGLGHPSCTGLTHSIMELKAALQTTAGQVCFQTRKRSKTRVSLFSLFVYFSSIITCYSNQKKQKNHGNYNQ